MKKIVLLVILSFLIMGQLYAEACNYVFVGKIGDAEGKALEAAITVDMRATLYAQPIGGTVLWMRDYPSVTTDATGNFTLILSDIEGVETSIAPTESLQTVFEKNAVVYLGVRVGGEKADEVQPRVQLVSVPGVIYAPTATAAATSCFKAEAMMAESIRSAIASPLLSTTDVLQLNKEISIVGNIHIKKAFNCQMASTNIIAENLLPASNVIIMYNLKTHPEIPEGWQICDGTNGTPDLRERFLYGAGDEGVGTLGGVKDATVNSDMIPSHTHTVTYTTAQSKDGNPDRPGDRDSSRGAYWYGRGSTTQQSTTETISVSDEKQNEVAPKHNNLPSYVTLVYLMNVGSKK